MNRAHIANCPNRLGQVGIKLFQGAALALILAITMPVRAADVRAVKSRVSPVYPEMAKRMRIGGVVKLEANIDAQGKVKEVKTVSGIHLLAVAAEDAVRMWRFEPGTADSNVIVEVNFAVPQ